LFQMQMQEQQQMLFLEEHRNDLKRYANLDSWLVTRRNQVSGMVRQSLMQHLIKTPHAQNNSNSQEHAKRAKKTASDSDSSQ